MSKLCVLIFKDLLIHWRGISGGWLFIMAFFLVIRMIRPLPGQEQEMGLLFVLNLYLYMLYTDWFVYREKSKGTFALLRCLPVADAHIVSSKFLLIGVLQIVGFPLSTFLVLPDYLRGEHLVEFSLYLLAILCFGSFNLLTKWLLSVKLGQSVPFVLAFLLVLVVASFERLLPRGSRVLAELWSAGTLQAGLAVIGTGVIAGCWYLMVVLFRSRDTYELLD